MTHAAADIASMVFRPAVIEGAAAFSLDRKALAILMEFDGSRTVAAVARQFNLDLASIAGIVRRLSELGLIEPVTDASGALDRTLIEHIAGRLAMVIGPLAPVVIEEEIRDMGYGAGSFPTSRAQELIDRLAATIRREEKREVFLAEMAELVKDL